MNHEQYMEMALGLAQKALGRTSPNPIVGALIVKDGKVIGRGYHQKAGTPHAEIHALKEAGEAARGAIMYVTLEPCSHYGRTPPCVDAIIKAGLSEVIIAMEDPNPLVAGKGIEMLKVAGIRTVTGILEEKARRSNEVFYMYMTTGKPFVALKTAMTLDGKIATPQGDSKWITGEVARQAVHQLRNRYDAVMVGLGTVIKDDPQLTTRLDTQSGRDAHRIIVDSRGEIPLESRVLSLNSAADTLIAVTHLASGDKLRLIQEKGAKVLNCPVCDGEVDLVYLMNKLGEQGITSILLEGGGTLNAAALRTGIIDKVYAFIAPKILGGVDSLTPVEGVGMEWVKDAISITDTQVTRYGEDVLIEGYVNS